MGATTLCLTTFSIKTLCHYAECHCAESRVLFIVMLKCHYTKCLSAATWVGFKSHSQILDQPEKHSSLSCLASSDRGKGIFNIVTVDYVIKEGYE
jgi:hypothetical protein